MNVGIRQTRYKKGIERIIPIIMNGKGKYFLKAAEIC